MCPYVYVTRVGPARYCGRQLIGFVLAASRNRLTANWSHSARLHQQRVVPRNTGGLARAKLALACRDPLLKDIHIIIFTSLAACYCWSYEQVYELEWQQQCLGGLAGYDGWNPHVPKCVSESPVGKARCPLPLSSAVRCRRVGRTG